MSAIRVARGTATGPTETAAFDAALAAANLQNYNLVELSSVVPAGADLEVVGTAPDLGPAGTVLDVVMARATAEPHESACAGLGWAREPGGRGIFYEAAGEDEATVRDRVETGLAAGRRLRDWSFEEEDLVLATAGPAADAYTTAVVVAAYGRGRPVL